MYSLFNVDPKREYGVARLGEWKAVQDGLKRNVVAMLEHYRHASYATRPDHLLIQILQSINVPLSLNIERYYANIDNNALSVANSFQLTTPFGQGKIFKGVFFNKGISEVIIAFEEWFNAAEVEKNWQDITAVRVLSHPFTSLGLQVPNGNFISPETGVATIGVNVSLLAVQYRAFRNSEQLKQIVDPSYVQRNLMHFMHMYVLPNMLESYLDYALFNRFDSLYNDRPMYSFRVKSVIYQADYQSQVNSIYTRLIQILKRSSYSAAATLAAIPVVSVPDLRRVFYVPDVAPTRQILWSVVLSRLPMLLFLVRNAKKNDLVKDQTDLLDVYTLLTRIKRQRMFDSALPKDLYQLAMADIDEILGVL